MKTIGSRKFFGLRVKLTDLLILGALGLYSALAPLYPSRVRGSWLGLIMANGLAALIFLGANLIAQRSSSPHLRFLLRTLSVQLVLLYIYSASLRLQLILFPTWHDQTIVDLEASVLGVQPTVWIQKFIRPWLTEWLMFCYVFYVPVYPILSLIIYRRHGEEKNENYLFYIALAIVFCTLGFLAFPVAGPLRHIGDLYTQPLRGYLFTGVSELIRERVHTPGGTIPSIHCAAATIMWWTAYRYSRPAFFVLAPVILSLYISTVYGRFHYAFDVVAGILAAFLMMALGPVLIKAWNRFKLEP